jgi:transposase InsO family protein
VYSKGNELDPLWRVYLPENLETKVINFGHQTLGHAGTDKTLKAIMNTFYIRNLGKKIQKTLSGCETCQQVKFPNRSLDVESRSHLPQKPGELLTVDLYGPLPAAKFGNRYIFVCLDTFSKHVRLYPLRSATTRACLKIKSEYIPNVTRPKCIFSDHGSQFTNQTWRKALEQLSIDVRYSPIRHPASNPSERYMRELSKYFRIYCHKTQKRWPDLLPTIQHWFNSTVCEGTGYTAIELMFDSPAPNLFAKLVPRYPGPHPKEETIAEKSMKAYTRMRQRAAARKERRQRARTHWNPKLFEIVLVRTQPISDATKGISGKLERPYQGPWKVTKIVSPSIFELTDQQGRNREIYNKRTLKQFRSEQN